LDNLTHTVFGFLIAETAFALRARRSAPVPQSLRPALLWSSGFANNLPDFDFLYTSISGEKIGYLLHHRGHTHTLVAALPQGVLIFGALLAWARFFRVTLARDDRIALAAVALLGPFFHIGLDATNVYGVHPLWPFVPRWYFGDSVFIVEPLLLFIGLSALFFQARRLAPRVLCAGIILVLLGFGFVVDIVPGFVAVALTLAAAAIFAGLQRVSAARRPLAALALWGAVTLGFFLVGLRAKAQATSAGLGLLPGSRLLDVAASPMPGNPFCYETWSVHDRRGEYVVVGSFVAPLGTDVARCPPRMTGTATLSRVTAPAPEGVRWVGEFRAPIAELDALRQRDCRVAALLRFFRVPYVELVASGARVMGDLRFDREPDLGFGEVLLPKERGACPPYVPGWTPPRSDLFDAP
jgi:inner membrane protein